MQSTNETSDNGCIRVCVSSLEQDVADGFFIGALQPQVPANTLLFGCLLCQLNNHLYT